ncbi:MAG: uroporphyrinogen decarboxylase family protein [Candidatus Methanospirareceae archaeon]
MNCKERLFAVFEQKGIDRVPCPGILQHGTVDLMDACGAAWPEAHTDGEKLAKLTWAAYEIAGLEGVRVPFTVYIEAEALGAELFKWKKDNHPMVKKHAINSLEDIDKMEVPDFKREGKLMQATLKAIEILKPKCDKEKIPLTAAAISPATMLLDAGVGDTMRAMIWVKKNPEEMKKLLRKLKDVYLSAMEAYVDAGVDVIMYNDAIGPEVGEKQYIDLGCPEINKECVRKTKERGVYVVLHACSKRIMHLADLYVESGVHCLSFAEMIRVKDMRERVGDKIAIMGGVNQLTTLLKGTPEDVKEEAKRAIDEGVDVLAPGCGFGPKTPLANMKAMVEAVKEYGHNGRLAKKK